MILSRLCSSGRGIWCGMWRRRRGCVRGTSADTGVPRRVSFRRWCFWATSLPGEEPVGGSDEGDVVVPAGPFTAFVVVETKAGLQLPVVVLSVPPVMYLNQVIPSHLR